MGSTYVRAAVHFAAGATAAYAAHADAVAITKSSPPSLSGDVVGRNTSGAASFTLAPAGNEITRERDTVAFTEVSPPQGRVAATGAVPLAAAAAAHAPAVDALVPPAAQQRHAVQPTVRAAAAEQQQPPRHSLVPQSAAEAQGSPGLNRAQEPVPGWQDTQPAAFAAALQQKPLRQEPEAQEALDTHAAPGVT